MSFKAGDAYYQEFTTANPTTLAAQNADSLPVATANHNGTDDAGFTLTVTNLDTGRYKISGTIPAGYVAGDVVNVTVAATVATVNGKVPVDSFQLDSRRFADVTNAFGVISDVRYSVGVAVSNYDLVLAGATANTVTLPALDASSNAIPDSQQYQFTVWQVVGGTGVNQLIVLTTNTAAARTYNVLIGTMPVQLDGTSQLILINSARAQVIAYYLSQDPATIVLNAQTSSYQMTGSVGAAIGRIGSAQIVTTSVVTQTGNASLIRGDSYYAADSRALAFTDSLGVWPNLTGATVTFNMGQPIGMDPFVRTMTVTNPGAVMQNLRLELAPADTTPLALGVWGFWIEATLSNGHPVRLINGYATITA